MTNNNAYILSGPIRSGKTTQLLRWSAARRDVYGILTPEIEGKRVFMDAHSRDLFAMEASPDDVEIISVGRYVFSQSAFQKAQNIIRNASGNNNAGWLIIDEIGPLELNNDGFADVLSEAVNSISTSLKILLVVREELSEKVKIQFGLNDAMVMTNIDLII